MHLQRTFQKHLTHFWTVVFLCEFWDIKNAWWKWHSRCKYCIKTRTVVEIIYLWTVFLAVNGFAKYMSMDAFCGQRIFPHIYRTNTTEVMWFDCWTLRLVTEPVIVCMSLQCLHPWGERPVSTRYSDRLPPAFPWGSGTGLGPAQPLLDRLGRQNHLCGFSGWQQETRADQHRSERTTSHRCGSRERVSSYQTHPIQMTKPQKARLHLKVTEMIREAEAVEH